jgi:hypothetical protein
MGRPKGRWSVECPAYSVGHLPTRETAERRLAEVEALGACMFDHTIEEAAADG